MAVLCGQQLSCSKKDRMLFEQVSLSVESGELWYLTGPNGAGKTSLLRILVGLSWPAEGQVLYQGLPLDDVQNRLSHELVYIGHHSGLNGQLSAESNLRYWCALHHIEPDSDDIFAILALLGLVGREDIAVSQLSAGQQRRVALARLWLHKEAKLWVLDEPFTALDAQGIALLEARFKAFLAAGGAIVMTSHQTLASISSVQELKLAYRL